ncbi:alpha/beta fold hydrolase [Sciscionella marina]|uniref:alpha/beta fold hydrolase n=1 Tax=Sciscionella marina TaxID=508770 RepID=UPI001F09FC80|nr:alpha/beta hydrolase [Sciscionella marina]
MMGRILRITLADVGIYFTASTRRSWDSRKPVVLGLHGGPGIDGAQLRYFLAPQQDWATVVVPDQRGHGRSDRSDPAHWTLDQWANDVRQFVEILGLTDVLLVGTSFGGFVVQRFLASHPGVVRGGVIVGSSARRAAASEIIERYRELGGEDAARVMARTLHDPSPENEQEWARVCAPLARLRPPGDVLTRIVNERITTPEVNEHFMATFADLDLRADLSTVREPLLVLAGAEDPLTPPDVAAEIQKHSGAEVTFQLVERAGHQVLWDQPERSNRLLREFAGSLDLPL